MAEERLRLQAEFRDNASAGIRKIKEQMQGIRRFPGMEAASTWMEEFHEKAGGFVKEGGGVAGVMSSMGIGGLAAAGSLAELVKHFTELGRKAIEVRELGRQVGLTNDQLNAYGKAAEGFGLSSEKIQGAIEAFRSQMPEFMVNKGALHDQISGMFPKLSEALKADAGDAQKQIEEIFRFAEQQKLEKSPQLQKQFFEQFFPGFGGDIEALEKRGPGAFLKSYEEAMRAKPGNTEEFLKQAEAFDKATREFNEALDRLEKSAAPSILGKMTEVAKELKDALHNLDAPGEKWQEIQDRWSYRGRQWKGQGDFAPAAGDKEARDRISRLQREAEGLKDQEDEKSRIRSEEIEVAIDKLNNYLKGMGRGEDGNALRRNDEMPAGYHRTAYSAGDRGAPEVAHPLLSLASFLETAQPVQGPLRPLLTQTSAPEVPHPSLLTRASFGPEFLDKMGLGALKDMSDPIALGTKTGVLAAFREWAQQPSLDKNARPGGFQNASVTVLEGDDDPKSTGGQQRASGGAHRGLGRANLAGGEATGEHADFIREQARKLGIDPRVAVAVAKSEGLGVRWGTGIDAGTSFGDFQLHVGGGLGDTFKRQTRLDPTDPANWKAMDQFALKYASKHGWGSWYGARRIGVTGMMGIGGRGSGDSSETTGSGSVGTGDPVGLAEHMLGANGAQAQAMLKHRMTPGEWCADFVNGVLQGAGGKGVNSSMAAAFNTWGRAVSADNAKRGDVILERHGNRTGHVGIATGEVKRDASGHVSAVRMVSGNYGGRVRENWERVGQMNGMRRGEAAVHGALSQLNGFVTKEAGSRAENLRRAQREHERGDRERVEAPEGRLDIHLHDPRGHVRRTGITMAGMSAKVRRWPTATHPNENG